MEVLVVVHLIRSDRRDEAREAERWINFLNETAGSMPDLPDTDEKYDEEGFPIIEGYIRQR